MQTLLTKMIFSRYGARDPTTLLTTRVALQLSLTMVPLELDTFPTYELFLYKVFTPGEVLMDYTY